MERWDIWSWRCWKDTQKEVSSSWKCREEVGLTVACDREVLVEATEVNKINQTKSVERREEAQERTGREGTYFYHKEEDISFSLRREMRKMRN